MAEYIEREALLDSLENAAKKLPNNRYSRGFKHGLEFAASCAVEAPAVDVVGLEKVIKLLNPEKYNPDEGGDYETL